MKNPVGQRLVSASGLIVALVLLVVGSRQEHKVYDANSLKVGLIKYETISEFALVIDATFSGVRGGDRLTSTYDRSVTRGKRSCPT